MELTTYNKGVLWSVANYVNGKREGQSTSYWDNGKPRTVSINENNKEISSQTYPKFNRPAPVVRLRIEANQQLYAAWKHIPVTDYPTALNLDEVGSSLIIPAFLAEVHQRNLAGQLKSDYEDCSTFNDGIAYFVQVNESGEVTEAKANGSGVYSGGSWNTYIPCLKQLRFSPGRIRGRAVKCQVVAWVDHTFEESVK